MTEPAFHLAALADISGLVASLPKADTAAETAARARQDSLTKPPGSLGRLEEMAVFMAGFGSRISAPGKAGPGATCPIWAR